jgi:hypothetical protein
MYEVCGDGYLASIKAFGEDISCMIAAWCIYIQSTLGFGGSLVQFQ